MKKRIVLFLYLILMITTSIFGRGKRDHLEGLVYETEDWSLPKDAWVIDKESSNKWCLWTKEEDVWNKRSNGASLKTPHISRDRKTPEEGAPPLHTVITGIPKGQYRVYMSPTNRTLAFSFDGKKWLRSEKGETNLGIFKIEDGRFEIWVDDFYADPENLGTSYYDYIRFVLTDELPTIDNVTAFTLPNGNTQISWISSVPAMAATIRYGQTESELKTVEEGENGLRNHVVVLSGLETGKKYRVHIDAPINIAGRLCPKESITIIAGERPIPGPTQKRKIRLQINEPTKSARTNWPVTSGIPLEKGVLASVNEVAIVNEKGEEIPARFEAFYHWQDGSVKWLVCNFLVDTQVGKPTFYYLETGKKHQSCFVNQQMEKRVREILNSSESKIVLKNGQILTQRLEEGTIESTGPVCTTLKAEGDYLDSKQKPMFRWRCHITSFINGMNRIRWYIGNNNGKDVHTPIRNAVWDMKNIKKKGSIELSDGTKAESDIHVLQDLEKHVIIETEDKKQEKEHSDGCLRYCDSIFWIRDFWQTWPKGYQIKDGRFEFAILPELPKKDYPPKNWQSLEETMMHFYWYQDGCYLFKRGMELESEIWFIPNWNNTADTKTISEWMSHPLFAVCESEYYCRTKAFGAINPARTDQYAEFEDAFDISFKNLEKGRVRRGEYGWMNFGDWFGERTWNWGNNEYDLPYITVVQFARTGRMEYLKRGVEMSRHYTTIDYVAWPWGTLRELMYAHSTGHVGGFIRKDDPRIVKQENFVANLVGGMDGSGGHAHHPGNYLIGCLTGDKRICEVAETACWNQARRYTPDYHISIERAVGWALGNAVYSWQYTGNPYYLNAAKIFFESIRKTQNPITGCFDLLQDQSECNCPDKKEHRGGKAFAVGVLLHSLARYYETSSDPEVKKSIIRCADWLINYSWNEEKKGFRYKTGCPKYADSGWYSIIVTEGIAYATELTGDPKYIKFVERTIGEHLYNTTGDGRGTGKSFTQNFRHLPHLLYYFQKHNIVVPKK